MKNKNIFQAIFLWSGFFAFGLYISLCTKNFFSTQGSHSNLNSTEAEQYFSNNNKRNARHPSAIRKDYDFSELEGSPLDFATKQRILSGMQFNKENAEIGISFGNFVIKSEHGEKIFVCDKYQKIQLTFYGEGQATDGQKPQMVIEGNCEVSSDINQIRPLYIPVQKIMETPPGVVEFDFRESHPIWIKFDFINDSWPTTWSLIQIRLLEPHGNASDVVIIKDDIEKILNGPSILEF